MNYKVTHAPKSSTLATRNITPAPLYQDDYHTQDAIEPAEKDEWLISFVDILLLLLTLFVLLYAVAKTQNTQSTQDAISTIDTQQTLTVAAKPTTPAPVLPIAQSTEHTFDAIDEITSIVKDESIYLAIQSSILFQAGSAQIESSAYPLLDEILIRIPASTAYISIEGHTDNSHIGTAFFPSNWELSAARASNVIKYLITRGIPADKLRAIGYADTQPIADNQTAEGREKNRRVAIAIHLNNPS